MIHTGLVLDIDGTLLRDGSETLHTQDVAAIQALLSRHVPVIIATGRTRLSALPLLAQLRVTEPVIASLGTLTFCPLSGDVEETVPLVRRDLESLCRWGCDHHLTPHVITQHGTLLPGASQQQLEMYAPFLRATDVQIAESAALMVVFSSEDRATRQALLDMAYEQELECLIYRRRHLLICIHASTDKGLALQRLAQRRHWDLSTFVALGDDSTDVPVFEAVGMGIAIGTKSAELASVAQETLSLAPLTSLADRLQSLFAHIW